MATRNDPRKADEQEEVAANRRKKAAVPRNDPPATAGPQASASADSTADPATPSPRTARAPRSLEEPNSIRPTKRRGTSRPTRPSAADAGSDSRSNGKDAPPRTGSRAPSSERARAGESSASDDLVPEDVRRRFVQIGRKYYFPDGARAFTDRGRRLTTPSENTEVIRSLVTIAHARGWNDITVSGTERFRKEAWFAARRAGLEVRGYRASELEHEQLARLMSRRDPEFKDATKVAEDAMTHAPGDAEGRASSASGEARVSSRERKGSLIVGRLADHGAATYRHDPHQAMSHFVKLETARGERTIWGVDLERALRESLTRPQLGDEVGLRAVRQDPVTVKTQERDAQGRVLGHKDLATHRNRWILEKRAFFEERRSAARALRDPSIEPKRAVQDHPALVGTYLNLHAAELAAKQFRDPQDRERFVSLVRNALADSVARGEPLSAVRLREPAAAGRSSADQPSTDRRTARSARVPERDRAPARS